MKRYCPRCGMMVGKGERCRCQPEPRRKGRATDAERAANEPWRKAYGSREYQQGRQEAMARTKGRCTDCGLPCAWYDGTKWRTAGMGGEVDHVVPLAEGGTNGAANLALRCKRCHGKKDARCRRESGRA